MTNKENLEASNQLLARLVEEVHARGMRIILDGVFNHCGSFNKWMDRERIYEGQEGYLRGRMCLRIALIVLILSFLMRADGLITPPMMDGGF